jgi:Mg-chelatase subunit ChlI
LTCGSRCRADAHGDRSEDTGVVAKRVATARERLAAGSPVRTSAAESFLRSAVERLSLSARGRDRVGQVASTVAALGGRDEVVEDDVAEALGYRLEMLL